MRATAYLTDTEARVMVRVYDRDITLDLGQAAQLQLDLQVELPKVRRHAEAILLAAQRDLEERRTATARLREQLSAEEARHEQLLAQLAQLGTGNAEQGTPS